MPRPQENNSSVGTSPLLVIAGIILLLYLAGISQMFSASGSGTDQVGHGVSPVMEKTIPHKDRGSVVPFVGMIALV